MGGAFILLLRFYSALIFFLLFGPCPTGPREVSRAYCASGPVVRKRPAGALRRNGTSRFLSDGRARAPGTRGDAVCERRFGDGRAPDLPVRAFIAVERGARSVASAHDHDGPGVRARRRIRHRPLPCRLSALSDVEAE